MFGLLRRRKRAQAQVVHNLRVGRPDVRPDRPSHVAGVRQGNDSQGKALRQGLLPTADPRTATGTAKRSTGIRPQAHAPIDPRMPNLSPS